MSSVWAKQRGKKMENPGSTVTSNMHHSLQNFRESSSERSDLGTLADSAAGSHERYISKAHSTSQACTHCAHTRSYAIITLRPTSQRRARSLRHSRTRLLVARRTRVFLPFRVESVVKARVDARPVRGQREPKDHLYNV